MRRVMISRRQFVEAVAAIPIAALPAEALAQSAPPWTVSADPGRVTVVKPGEPGEALIVTGRVFQLDGRTPLAGARLDLYHTDAAGWYSQPVNDPRSARLRASVVTDASGRYEIRTIRPAHYAGMSAPPPAHIHVHLVAKGLPEHWIESYHFEGDRFLPADAIEKNRPLGAFSAVLALQRRADGVFLGARDIRADPEVAKRNALAEGWYRGGDEHDH